MSGTSASKIFVEKKRGKGKDGLPVKQPKSFGFSRVGEFQGNNGRSLNFVLKVIALSRGEEKMRKYY